MAISVWLAGNSLQTVEIHCKMHACCKASVIGADRARNVSLVASRSLSLQVAHPLQSRCEGTVRCPPFCAFRRAWTPPVKGSGHDIHAPCASARLMIWSLTRQIGGSRRARLEPASSNRWGRQAWDKSWGGIRRGGRILFVSDIAVRAEFHSTEMEMARPAGSRGSFQAGQRWQGEGARRGLHRQLVMAARA
jgi:hypothetical protein